MPYMGPIWGGIPSHLVYRGLQCTLSPPLSPPPPLYRVPNLDQLSVCKRGAFTLLFSVLLRIPLLLWKKKGAAKTSVIFLLHVRGELFSPIIKPASLSLSLFAVLQAVSKKKVCGYAVCTVKVTIKEKKENHLIAGGGGGRTTFRDFVKQLTSSLFFSSPGL